MTSSSDIEANPFVSKLNANPALPIFGVSLQDGEDKGATNRKLRPTRPKSSPHVRSRHKVKKKKFKTFVRNNDGTKNIKTGEEAKFELSKQRPLSARNYKELAKASTLLQTKINKPIENLLKGPLNSFTKDTSKQYQSAMGVGNERWVSYTTKHVIEEYKRMDEQKAAEIWLAKKTMTDIKPVNKSTLNGIQSQAVPYDLQFLKKIGLDRKSLQVAGLSNHTIERVYRALFVYSFGFHEMLDEVSSNCVKHEKGGSGRLVAKIWEVFNALLEKCEGNGYKAMIASLQQDYVEQREITVKAYERRLLDAELIRTRLLSDLKIRTDERDETHANLRGKLAEIKTLNNTIIKYKNKLQKSEDENVLARQEMFDARKREGKAMEEVRNSENLILQLKQNVTDWEIKCNDLNGMLRESKNVRDEALRKEGMAMAMMNKLEMEIGTISSMKAELTKEIDREIRNRASEAQRAEDLERNALLLQSHLQRANKQIRSLEEIVKSNDVRHKVQLNKNEQLANAISELQLSKSKVEEELLVQTTKLNNAMVKNKELQTSLTTLQEKLEKTFADMDNINLVLRDNNTKMKSMKGEVLDVKLEKERLIKDLQEIESKYNTSQYKVLKMNERVVTTDKTVERLVGDLSNANKLRQELEVKIKELQLEITKKEENYQKLEHICYDQMRDMSEKMSANMTEVEEARKLNASAIPQLKNMKSEITTLTEVKQNLIAENARLSKRYRQEQLKSLSCMDLVSLQQDLGSVSEASIKQQKSEIEMIQKICDGTPWGEILRAPSDQNSAEEHQIKLHGISAVSATWASSLVSQAIENIVNQYSLNESKEVGHETMHASNEIIESCLDTDDNEMKSLLDSINRMKESILTKSRNNLVMHENNKAMISLVKSKVSKIQDIFYHRLHRDSHLKIS